MSDRPPQDGRWRFLRVAWLAYAIATVSLSIAVLAIYVTAYDDYDLSERLRATGRFTRQAMRAVSFPLGAPTGWLLNPPLEKSFGCGDENANQQIRQLLQGFRKGLSICRAPFCLSTPPTISNTTTVYTFFTTG